MKTITLRHIAHNDFIFSTKPAGVNTHSVDQGLIGQVELLQEELQENLWVVHRLDKGTSGAMIFARNKQAAAKLGEYFENRRINKRYLFLTDRFCDQLKARIQSHIEKKFNQFVSHKEKPPNSETLFNFLRPLGKYFLWDALPLSGKPHQIRLHAQDLGIPILGDQEHGGALFTRLCLHSDTLEFTWEEKSYKYQSPAPFWAEDSFQSVDRAEALTSIEKRTHSLKYDSQDCLRLSHLDNLKWRLDQFGPIWWLYWYGSENPRSQDLELWENLGHKFSKSIVIRKMLNRGKNPNDKLTWQFGTCPEVWRAYENEALFEFRRDQGLSPGLFLDQRENRYWVRQNSNQKSILNLFSYTGAFSVNAALGGAHKVVTVDLSKVFIEWSRRNFELNKINLSDTSKYEFWAMNTFTYLKIAAKKHNLFDLIICDPPSFSRSKEDIFRIEKDWLELLRLCKDCLKPNGQILFCTNYEGWTHEKLKNLLVRSNLGFKLGKTAQAGCDYEGPNEEHLLKSILLGY